MIMHDAKAVAAALPYNQLVDALDRAFAAGAEVPPRAHLTVPVPGGTDGTLLLMPAWRSGGRIGVKIATVFPDNTERDEPAVFASYLLMSAETGKPLAMLDGTEVTLRRTAAASALASRYLSREDASRLLMVGTGNLAPHLVRAHAAVRQIESVVVWGRRVSKAAALADELRGESFEVTVAAELGPAVGDADIISAATLATDPLILGEWLAPGQHIDLVGAFKPDMREADDEAIRRADVYVDTRSGAFNEAGEIVQALARGVITEADVRGELSDLATGRIPGRESGEQITLFKSVGTALEDLAGAELAMQNAGP